MRLDCPDCRAPIFSDDVDLVKTIAKCKSCNSIFDFHKQLPELGIAPGRHRKEISIPPGIEVLHLMSELEIMIKWRKAGSTFTVFFAIFWNIFVAFMCLIFIAVGEITALLFLSIFVMAGIYLIYASIGYMVNTTYIIVDDKYLSIEHKPINFLIQKNKYFNRDEIDQVFVKQYSVGSKNNTPVYAYAVELILKNKDRQPLVKGIHAVSDARYVEQEIEHYLGIRDRSVSDEYKVGLD